MPKGTRLMFTPKELDEIKRLYWERDLTIKQVGEHFGVSYTGMYNVMKRSGIRIKPNARKYIVDEHAFDKIDNQLAAYHLGFAYADANVYKFYFTMALAEKDKEHLFKLRHFLKSDTPITITDYKYVNYPNKSPMARITFSGIHLTNRLRELGIITGRPSIEPYINQIPDELHHHWLRGLFDGDGCATTTGKVIGFCGRKHTLEWVRGFLASHANRNPNIKLEKIANAKDCYHLRYKGHYNAWAVIDCMYADAEIWLSRKRDCIEKWPPLLSRSERVRAGWITRRANAARER